MPPPSHWNRSVLTGKATIAAPLPATMAVRIFRSASSLYVSSVRKAHKNAATGTKLKTMASQIIEGYAARFGPFLLGRLKPRLQTVPIGVFDLLRLLLDRVGNGFALGRRLIWLPR